jgi:flagellar M-ring protein FliF
MDFSKLLQNRPLLYSIIGGVAVVFVLLLIIGIASGNKEPSGVVGAEPLKTDVDLMTTDNLGKALEVQALLAKQGLTAGRKMDGTKSVLFLSKDNCSSLHKKCTVTDRDQAIIAIVQSGLMDKNVGLEIFDKGDFTSTKEDKRIRLSRAINGELARLIRNIEGVNDATVFISIPEQSMFASMQKPITATVQISLPSGEKLDIMKVKAVSNLLLGSVTGLVPENIAITDTNGNTYRSILDAGDEMLQKIEENDRYMQQKVAAQLDRLIGKDNYVVTVSTHLRQSPGEKVTIKYDPESRIPIAEQTFTEGLGDQTSDTGRGTNAVSVYLPNGLPAGGADSNQNRTYNRTAREVQYGVSKTQETEVAKAGIMEEISIAVTLDKNALPENTTMQELKELIAKAASPKVQAENVTIAFSDSDDPYLSGDRPSNLPKPDETGNPWWVAIGLAVIGSMILLKMVADKVRKATEEPRRELETLRQQNAAQEQMLSEIHQQAASLSQQQTQLAQGLTEQQQRVQQIATQASHPAAVAAAKDPKMLEDALSNISADLANADEDAADKIKSWIEAA